MAYAMAVYNWLNLYKNSIWLWVKWCESTQVHFYMYCQYQSSDCSQLWIQSLVNSGVNKMTLTGPTQILPGLLTPHHFSWASMCISAALTTIKLVFFRRKFSKDGALSGREPQTTAVELKSAGCVDSLHQFPLEVTCKEHSAQRPCSPYIQGNPTFMSVNATLKHKSRRQSATKLLLDW